jgi:hypothetical protein
LADPRLRCLDADDKPIDPALLDELLRKARKSGKRIRCPLCGWVPGKHDRWMCTCGYHWNTFDTRGKCPACSFQWTMTCCPSCQKWSPHEDWYEKDELR